MKQKETYTIQVECSNCKQYSAKIEIEKGVRVYKELQSRECPVCGCCELKRVKGDLTWTITNSTDDTISCGYTSSDGTPSIYNQETYLTSNLKNK